MRIASIYQIRNIINNKIYIGSSLHTHRREMAHKNLLRKNKHHSYKLQRVWNKYGEESFIFENVEIIFRSKEKIHYSLLSFLNIREQFYINKYKASSKNNYNVSNIVNVPNGDNPSQRTKNAWITRKKDPNFKITDTHRKNISESLKNSKLHQERNRLWTKSNIKKVFQYDLEGNFLKEYSSVSEAGKILNIYLGHIQKNIYGINKSSKGFLFSYNKYDILCR